MIVAVALVTILLLYAIRYCRRTYGIFEKMRVPGPKPKWIIGNIHQFGGKEPLDVFNDWYTQYGKIYGFYEGFRPSYVICDPSLTKQVLVKHFDSFSERPLFQPFVYYPDTLGLLNTCGEKWKQNRVIVASAFCFGPLAKMIKKVVRTSRMFSERLSQLCQENPLGFDISVIIGKFSLDAFLYCGFGWEESSLENPDCLSFRYLKAVLDISSADNPAVGIARIYPTLIPVLCLSDIKHRKLHSEFVGKLGDEIRKRREKKDEIEKQLDIVGHLMSSTVLERDEMNHCVKRMFSNDEVCGHAREQMTGGLGTVSAATNFTIYCLARNPDVQEKLIEEIDSVCGQNELDLTMLLSLDYLKCVIYESLRMFPVAPGVARVCTEDCVIDGIQFKKGWMVRVMLSPLYNDPEYFTEPEKFIPTRFYKDVRTEWEWDMFLPFGKGQRMCPGRKLGLLICKAAIVTLLQKYRVKTCKQTEISLATALKPNLCPRNGVHVQLEPRDISR